MENTESLRLKISIMEKELEIARMRLEYNLMIENEQERSSSASGLPPTTEQAVALPKSKIESSSAPQKETVSPCPSGKKLTASPTQTVVGKDKSNPLKGVDFPKILKQCQSSRLITEKKEETEQYQSSRLITEKREESNLRPNGNKEKPFKDVLIPTTNEKHYYVVFNGPFAGIYDEWKNAKAATENISNVRHKKFKSLLEATVAASKYAKEHECEPAKLINKADCLRPSTFSEVLKQTKRTKVSLGKPVSFPKKTVNIPTETEEQLSLAGFEYWYNEARTANEDKLVDDHFFTTDNANLSYFNFVKNANADQVYEAFRYGLVKTIYPSVNLQEIRSFPKTFINAVKKFRTKTNTGKADRDIFLKVSSAIPVFNDQGVAYEPHHIVQIGFSKDAQYSPSKVMPTSVEKRDLSELAKRKFGNILDKAYEFYDESRIFINYVDNRILLQSKKASPISDEDRDKVLQFRRSQRRKLSSVMLDIR